MKILAALSGGIDSSVIACMLKEQGHEVIGVRFTLWSDPEAPAIAQLLPNKCCNAQTASRSAFIAKMLGIPFHVKSLESAFKRDVVDPFLDGYAHGETPNPCIECNRRIKFGELMRLAYEYGCEKIATGHYARVRSDLLPDGTEGHVLLEATDLQKDQSYYLYGLTQDQLGKVIFPLGNMRKEDVYKSARSYGIPFDESYRESQDLCFYPEKEPMEFIKRHIQDSLTPGHIVRKDGTIVGMHDGLPLYTIGQRRGLGIGGLKIPLEVVGKNAVTNELIVADKGSVFVHEVRVRDVHWIAVKHPGNMGDGFECRTRSLEARASGKVEIDAESPKSGRFVFDKKRPPLTPGQSIVFYRGSEVMGGGIMHL